jgi:hypothetical protein
MITSDEVIGDYLALAATMKLIRTWWQQDHCTWLIQPVDSDQAEYDREGVTRFIYLLNGAGVKIASS